MLTLNFRLEPKYVIHHCLVNTSNHRFIPNADGQTVRAFQREARQRNPAAIDYLSSDLESLLMSGQPDWWKRAEEADRFLNELLEDPLAHNLLDETQVALEGSRQDWEANQLRTNEMMTEMLGTEIEDQMDVFVTHPSLKQGRYHRSIRAISWTFREDFRNYNMVYLWHEALHGQFPHDDLAHAVIELLTDNELRVRLNGGTYPPSKATATCIPSESGCFRSGETTYSARTATSTTSCAR